MLGRLLVVIGYVLIPCSIVAISFSLPIGIGLFVLSMVLIDNIKIRSSTPQQRTQRVIEAIRNSLLVAVLEQQQRLLKARVALALYAKYSRVPKAAEITRIYNRVQASRAALPDPQTLAQPGEQLALLSPTFLTDHRRTQNFINFFA